MATSRWRRGARASLAVVALAATAVPAFAQDAPAGAAPGASLATGPASPIVVTGRGLPESPAAPAYAVTAIDRETLRSSASGSIEDALADAVAGLQQFRRSDSRSANPSAQGLTLRGLGGNASSRTLVLLDGVPVSNPFFGYIPLSALSPARLAEARVTRGGGTGAFGSGAVAGTIELSSIASDAAPLLEGEALVDQRGDKQASATTVRSLGAGSLVASAQWDRGPGFWTTPGDQRVPASVRARYESWSAAVRAVAPLGATTEIQASLLAFDDHRTLRFEGADSRSEGQQGSLRLVGRGAWQFDLIGYVQAQDFGNVVISSSTFAPTLDQVKTPATGIGGKAELRPPIGPAHVLRLGTDWRRQSGHLVERPYSGGRPTSLREAGGTNDDLGFYLEDDWTLGALVLSGGLRLDRWSQRGGFLAERDAATGALTTDAVYPDRDGWATGWRAGALLRAAPGLSLRMAAYTGIRQPTLNELYRPYVVFPVRTLANPDLDPERLHGIEAGLDWKPASGVAISLTAFDDRVDDAVANVTVGTNLKQRQNVDAIHARGLEASADLRHGPLSLHGSLALTRSRVEASGPAAALDGMRPAQVPAMVGAATLAWTPAPRWRVAATVRRVSRQFEDDLETDVLPAATTLDATGEVPLGPAATLLLRAENLTDATVVTRNQAGSIDLGTPRTLWAGLRLDLR